MRRRQFLQTVAAALGLPAPLGLPRLCPSCIGLRASNGGRPFAGDGRYLTTISPQRAAPRRALIQFSLTGRARVRLEVVPTDTVRIGRPLGEVVWRAERRLSAGAHEVAWRPPRDLQPRTYQVRAVVECGRPAAGLRRPRPGSKAPAPGRARPRRGGGADEASYAPGEPTDLQIASDAPSLGCRSSTTQARNDSSSATCARTALAVTPPVRVDWSEHRDGPALLRFLRAGDMARAVSISSARRPPTAVSATRRSSFGRARFGDEARRGRARHEHLAGVQLPRRRRRRLG